MTDGAEPFGEARLLELGERHDRLGGEEIEKRILDDVASFVGGAGQHDDMTLVALEVGEGPGDHR